MVVPDKFAFEFDEFDVGVVDFSGYFWAPVVLNEAEFLVEVYFFHFLSYLLSTALSLWFNTEISL